MILYSIKYQYTFWRIYILLQLCSKWANMYRGNIQFYDMIIIYIYDLTLAFTRLN